MTELQKQLFSLKDEKYRNFNSKLIPTVDKDKIIGIRTPALRRFAKDFLRSDKCEQFIKSLPHEYYEENNLHGLYIQKIRNFDECIKALNEYLPFVDNWASCDLLNPPALKKNPEALLCHIRAWLKSEHTYTVRYGVKCLMDNFLEDNFTDEILRLVCETTHGDYYVKMVQAWFFATALAKQYDATLPYITEKRLDIWVHNKAIQKSVESYRISESVKNELKKLKIKNR